MIWMVLLGAISLIFGILLLVSPESLMKMSQSLNRMVNKVDEQVLRYRIGVGVSLLLAAIFLFVYAYMLGAY
jgi:hypothetical protein